MLSFCRSLSRVSVLAKRGWPSAAFSFSSTPSSSSSSTSTSLSLARFYSDNQGKPPPFGGSSSFDEILGKYSDSLDSYMKKKLTERTLQSSFSSPFNKPRQKIDDGVEDAQLEEQKPVDEKELEELYPKMKIEAPPPYSPSQLGKGLFPSQAATSEQLADYVVSLYPTLHPYKDLLKQKIEKVYESFHADKKAFNSYVNDLLSRAKNLGIVQHLGSVDDEEAVVKELMREEGSIDTTIFSDPFRREQVRALKARKEERDQEPPSQLLMPVLAAFRSYIEAIEAKTPKGKKADLEELLESDAEVQAAHKGLATAIATAEKIGISQRIHLTSLRALREYILQPTSVLMRNPFNQWHEHPVIQRIAASEALRDEQIRSEQFDRMRRYFPNLYLDWAKILKDFKSGKDHTEIWKEMEGERELDKGEARKYVESLVEKNEEEEEDDDEDDDYYDHSPSLEERDAIIRHFSFFPEYRPFLGPYLSDDVLQEVFQSPEEALYRIYQTRDIIETRTKGGQIVWSDENDENDEEEEEEREALPLTPFDINDKEILGNIDPAGLSYDLIEAQQAESPSLDVEEKSEEEEESGEERRDFLNIDDEDEVLLEEEAAEEEMETPAEKKARMREFLESLPGIDWERPLMIDRFNNVKDEDKREAKTKSLNENTWPHGDLKKLKDMMAEEKKKGRPLKNKKYPHCIYCNMQNPPPLEPFNVPLLQLLIDPVGNIRSKFETGFCPKHQRRVKPVFRRAVNLGFFSYKKGLFTVINPFLLPPYKPIMKGVNPEDIFGVLGQIDNDDVWEEIDSVIDGDEDAMTSDLQFRYPLGNPIVLKINKIKK